MKDALFEFLIGVQSLLCAFIMWLAEIELRSTCIEYLLLCIPTCTSFVFLQLPRFDTLKSKPCQSLRLSVQKLSC